MAKEMNIDWRWIQGRMDQDEALDNFEAAVEDYKRAEQELVYWMTLAWWAEWYSERKN